MTGKSELDASSLLNRGEVASFRSALPSPMTAGERSHDERVVRYTYFGFKQTEFAICSTGRRLFPKSIGAYTAPVYTGSKLDLGGLET